VCIATYLSCSQYLCKYARRKEATHKNVPPENSKSIPVRQREPAWSPLEDPTICAKRKVTNAPTGAARLNTSKCALAVRLDKPCFNSIDVRPKDAGALCTIIARKMMKLRPVSVLDAPNAIPSAAA
jgi:hypothetical protein